MNMLAKYYARYYANQIIELEREHTFPAFDLIIWISRLNMGHFTCPCKILDYTRHPHSWTYKKKCLFYPVNGPETTETLWCGDCPRSKIWGRMRDYYDDIDVLDLCKYLIKRLTKILEGIQND